jgi:hypothetical protein
MIKYQMLITSYREIDDDRNGDVKIRAIFHFQLS